MFYMFNRAVRLGAAFGIYGVTMLGNPDVETPEIDSTAMEGAVGIVITLAAVIITLYIVTIVVGSVSGVAESGLNLPTQWNTTVQSMDTQAQSTMTLAGVLPIAIVGVGILVVIISAFAMR